MTALLETTVLASVAAYPRANLACVRSFHHHEHRSARVRRASIRARGHGVVHMDHVSKADASSGSVELHQLLTTCRGLHAPGLFTRIQFDAYLPPRRRRAFRTIVLLPDQRGARHLCSARPGSRQTTRNTLAHHQPISRSGDVLHLSVPSSIPSSVKSPWTEGMPTSCQSLPKWSAM